MAAHCNCMAGLGEACSHVASLMFYIDAAVRIRDSKTVTQEKLYWILPSALDKVDYVPVSDMVIWTLVHQVQRKGNLTKT